jgi:hypothetical protein
MKLVNSPCHFEPQAGSGSLAETFPGTGKRNILAGEPCDENIHRFLPGKIHLPDVPEVRDAGMAIVEQLAAGRMNIRDPSQIQLTEHLRRSHFKTAISCTQRSTSHLS